MPKTRKTKAKYQDFHKVKLKIGKKLPRAQNETVAAFKTRNVVIPQQIKGSDESPSTTAEKHNITDSLSKLTHHNTNMRTDALTVLRQIIANDPQTLNNNLSSIMDRVSPMLTDRDSHVRSALLKLLQTVFSQTSAPKFVPFMPFFSANLCRALLHLSPDIRWHSHNVLDLLIECYPTLTCESRDILENMLQQVSALKSGSGNIVTRLDWRSRVLTRLKTLLEMTLSMKQASVLKISPVLITWPPSSTGVCVLGTDAFKYHLGTGQVSGLTDLLSTAGLRKVISVVLPVVMEGWLEVRPNNHDVALSSEAVLVLHQLLKLLYTIIQLVKLTDNTPDLLLWFKDNYYKDIKRYIMPCVPFKLDRDISRSLATKETNNSTTRSNSDIVTAADLDHMLSEVLSIFPCDQQPPCRQ